jgi:transcriptional repressor NrdR
MKCPFCGQTNSEVVETRIAEEGRSLRRRRRCLDCQKRFTTYERVDKLPIMVIKRNGTREVYNRDKAKGGIIRSVEKTTVMGEKIEQILDELENDLKKLETTEVESSRIGEILANKLKSVDKVAYIRFASVFRRFVDIEDIEREIKKLL